MTQSHFLLIVSNGPNRETYSFSQDRVNIGRARDSDLCINERVVSRHHCHIERIDGSFFLVDDGGQNKVRYQGAPVTRTELQVGDSFVIGNMEFELALPSRQPGTTEEISSANCAAPCTRRREARFFLLASVKIIVPELKSKPARPLRFGTAAPDSRHWRRPEIMR